MAQGFKNCHHKRLFLPLFYQKKGEKTMNETRMKAALDLLRLKAIRQMTETKTSCMLDEEDVQEILLVAGMGLDPKSDRELEVI